MNVARLLVSSIHPSRKSLPGLNDETKLMDNWSKPIVLQAELIVLHPIVHNGAVAEPATVNYRNTPAGEVRLTVTRDNPFFGQAKEGDVFELALTKVEQPKPAEPAKEKRRAKR